MRIEFELNGPPRPKQRPRFNARTKSVHTPEATKKYERAIGNMALVALHKALRKDEGLKWEMGATYRVVCEFHHKKSLSSCPDGDNVTKAVLDGMEGILFTNDRNVLEVTYMTFPDCDEAKTCVKVEIL